MKQAFTLVELIVVITILAILGTIGFISLQGYSASARDAKRISDVSSLSSKINIEQIRGTSLSDLIEIGSGHIASGSILGRTNDNIITFGKINFDNLRETENNFKDPNGRDYLSAYAIGMGSNSIRYRFFEIGTISEKENKTKIVGNYYILTQEDIPSLFLSGSIESPIYYKNNGEELIYGINDNSNNNEEDSNIFGHFTFDSSTQTIIDYSIDGPEDVVIPSHINGVEVKNIGREAFYKKGLKNVILPESIEIIGSWAFRDNQLTNITIPDSVTIIGATSFRNNKLTEVILPEGLIYLGDWSFGANNLREIIIPEGITEIKEYTFDNNQLTSVIIPYGVTSIGTAAFRGNKLINIIIPDSVTLIGYHTFAKQDNSVGSGTIKAPQYICDTYYFPNPNHFDKSKLKSCIP